MSQIVAVLPNSFNPQNSRNLSYQLPPFASAIDHPTADRVYRVIWESAMRGWNDPPIRYLAKTVDRCRRQVQRALQYLEKIGRLIITRRRVTNTRNDTSIYEIPGLRGVGDIYVTESSKNKYKIPKTPKPAASASAFEVLKAQLARALDAIKARDRYIRRGEQINRGQKWRERNELREIRMGVEARTGTKDAFLAASRFEDDGIPRWY